SHISILSYAFDIEVCRRLLFKLYPLTNVIPLTDILKAAFACDSFLEQKDFDVHIWMSVSRVRNIPHVSTRFACISTYTLCSYIYVDFTGNNSYGPIMHNSLIF